MTDEPPGTPAGTTRWPTDAVGAYQRAIESGDADKKFSALDQIVRAFLPLIQGVARRFRLSDQEADDVSQIVWLRLVERLPNFREPKALPGWIATTARRESLRVLADSHRSVGDPLDPATLSALHIGMDDPEVDEVLRRAEHARAIREGLAELDPQHAQLLLLLAEPSASFEEIRKRLGIPIGSIGPTRARSLAKLRESAAVTAFMAGTAAGTPADETSTQRGPVLTVVPTPSRGPGTQGEEEGESLAVRPTIAQIEAAKLRLVTDRRLGKKSPEWLRRVAKGLPAQGVTA